MKQRFSTLSVMLAVGVMAVVIFFWTLSFQWTAQEMQRESRAHEATTPLRTQLNRFKEDVTNTKTMILNTLNKANDAASLPDDTVAAIKEKLEKDAASRAQNTPTP